LVFKHGTVLAFEVFEHMPQLEAPLVAWGAMMGQKALVGVPPNSGGTHLKQFGGLGEGQFGVEEPVQEFLPGLLLDSRLLLAGRKVERQGALLSLGCGAGGGAANPLLAR